MNVAYENGTTLVDYPLLEENVVTHIAERIVVDSGAIKLDSAHQNLDNSHLVLDGVLNAGQDYFKVVKSGVTLLNCDYQGVLNAHKLSTNLIDVQQSVDLYGDAAVQYTPQNSAGGNITGYTYRFGKNQEELGDFSTQGDGMELKEPSGNEILLQVNDDTPTIEIQRFKNPGVEVLLVRNTANNKVVSLDDEGIHIRRNDQNVVLLTPGNTLNLGDLRDGFQTHRFTLDQNWTASSAETIVEIYGATSAAIFRHVQNLEVAIDDLSQPGSVSDINARVYIKRWGGYRNTTQRVWVVLGVEFNGDTNIPSGKFLRLSFNNKLIL
jgi:hypothetical protein